MLRLSVSELTTFRWTFDEDVKNYKQYGYEGVGVWRQKLTDYGEAHAIDLLAKYDLAVSSLLWAGGFTGSDGQSHREGIDDGIEALRLAATLRANCLVVYSGARGGHTRHHSRRLLLSALDELAGVATDLGVTLAIEPMHPGCASDWTFLTSLDEALELVSEIRSGTVQIVYDTYHLTQEGFDEAYLRSIIDRIAVVHVGDSCQSPEGEQNRCPLGAGNLPLHQVLETLERLNYRGFCELELMGEDSEGIDYHDLLASAKQFFAQHVGAI